LNLNTLIEPIIAGLPADRRQIMEGVVGEFALGDTQRLLLALVAAASKRERQLIRILLRDMEVKEEQDRIESENQ
jgi:capsular polysaccharide biosynthesis protein